MSVRVHVWQDGVRVRKGASSMSIPSNIIGEIDEGDYVAIKQCAGGQVNLDQSEGGYKNFWWVQLDTPVGRGWVTAVYVKGGKNQERVPHVPTAETVNT